MFCVKCGREASRPQQITGGRTPAALCHGCDKSAGYCRCTPMTTADEHDTAAQVAEDASTGRTTPSATDLLAERSWNACVEVRVFARKAPEPVDMQTGEEDDYCMAATRRDGVWNDKDVADPPLCCWRPPDHDGRHHDPYQHLDWWLDANEAFAAAIDLGLAWQDAVDALPAGGLIRVTHYLTDEWVAEGWHRHRADDGAMATATTLTEALQQLAARLREVRS